MKRKPTQVPDSLKTVDIKALLRSRGVFLKLKINQDNKQRALPVVREYLKNKKKVVKQEVQRYQHFTNEEAMAYRDKQIHIIEVLEKRFDLKVQQFITKIVSGFLAHLESEIATTKSLSKFQKDYFDDSEDDYIAQAQLDFTPLLVDQAVLAGQEAYKIIGSDDIYTPYKYRDTIAKNVEKFTKSMLETDRDTMVNIISNGIKDGKTVAEIRGAIQADFDNITKSQAMRITRTEVARVSNQATVDAWEQSGIVEGKQWVIFGADDECADYDGDIVALDANFYGIDTDFQDGDPPLHPNCKCGTIPILIDETKVYNPKPNKALYGKIKDLEDQIDKRTKAFKELKAQNTDDQAYIKSLEKYLGVDDES